MANTIFDAYPYTITLPTDKDLAKHIANIYKKNDCWTWYDDFEWYEHETFIRDNDDQVKDKKYGSFLPINLVVIQAPGIKQTKLATYMEKARKIIK